MNKKYISEDLNLIFERKNIKSYNRTIFYFICFFILVVILISYVKYPEKLIGSVSIVPTTSYNKIHSPTTGEIEILVRDGEDVNRGQELAILKSSGKYQDIIYLDQELGHLKINNSENIESFLIRENLELGELEDYFYKFLIAIQEFKDLKVIKLRSQKILNKRNEIKILRKKLEISNQIKNKYDEKNLLTSQYFESDSSLFEDEIINSSDIFKSEMRKFDSQLEFLSYKANSVEIRNSIQQLESEVELLKKLELKEISDIYLKLKRAYYTLKAKIGLWKREYLIVAPINGEVQFVSPQLSDYQQVGAGKPLFVILPQLKKVKGLAMIKPYNYGKIKNHDTVNIKLDDYAYQEYGIVKGVVSKKSNILRDSVYLLELNLYNNLETTQNYVVNYSYNMSGNFEYITKKRSILTRIFEQLIPNF